MIKLVPIESLNRKIKKVAKNKSIFLNDPAFITQVYLAVEEAARKMDHPPKGLGHDILPADDLFWGREGGTC